jgi:hypothetical protein
MLSPTRDARKLISQSERSRPYEVATRRPMTTSAQLPTRGLVATQRFVLGAVVVSHLLLLDCFLLGRSLRRGPQAAPQAA